MSEDVEGLPQACPICLLGPTEMVGWPTCLANLPTVHDLPHDGLPQKLVAKPSELVMFWGSGFGLEGGLKGGAGLFRLDPIQI